MIEQEYNPDWVSPPGDTIKDILKEQNLSVDDFAKQMGYPLQDIELLLEGKVYITLGGARLLTKVLGGSVEFWMARDFQYWENTFPEAHCFGQSRMEI